MSLCCFGFESSGGASSGSVTGSGTLNYVPKWTPNGTTLGNSQITDDGTAIGLGMVGVGLKLNVLANTNGDFEAARFYSNNLAQNLTLGFGGLNSTYYLKLVSGSGQDIILSPARTTLIQGIDATSSNYALKVDNSASSPLLYVRNDGFISFSNNDLTLSSTAGYSLLDVPNYKAFRFSISGAGGTYMEFSHNVGNISLYKQTIIAGGITPSSNTTLDIGNYGGLSSLGVRNISLDSSGTGYGVFAIGKQGLGGIAGSATIRFSYDPVSFGGGINDTNNNYFRVGIGQDVITTHRVTIADGINISTGKTSMPNLQIGNVGLASGDLYVDTAANILANGDLVVGRKV